MALIHDAEVERAVLLHGLGPLHHLPALTPRLFLVLFGDHPLLYPLFCPLSPPPQTYPPSLLLHVLIINPNRRYPQNLSCRDQTPHPSSNSHNRVGQGNGRPRKLVLGATKHRPRTLKSNAQNLLLILELIEHQPLPVYHPRPPRSIVPNAFG